LSRGFEVLEGLFQLLVFGEFLICWPRASVTWDPAPVCRALRKSVASFSDMFVMPAPAAMRFDMKPLNADEIASLTAGSCRDFCSIVSRFGSSFSTRSNASTITRVAASPSGGVAVGVVVGVGAAPSSFLL